MKLVCIALLSTICLASCATAPPPSAEKISSDVGIDRASVVTEFPCVHAIAPKGARSAAQQEATCIRTRDRLIVARNDKTSGKFVSSSSIPLGSMSAVRLYKLAANRQIQIETDAGVHVRSGLPRMCVRARWIMCAVAHEHGVSVSDST